MLRNSLRALLTEIIDYAGLFPPASEDMQTAVEHFAEYSDGPRNWLLGRFVVPVSSLPDFDVASGGHLPALEDAIPWRLTAIAGADLKADLEEIEAFNEAHVDPSRGLAVVDTLEMVIADPSHIEKVLDLVPDGLQPYFEAPSPRQSADIIQALAGTRGRAKIRTGGITPDSLPSPAMLARFLKKCARGNVPFKATAGLHHPVRGGHRLTLEPEGPTAVMHGFINIFLAATQLYSEGASEAVAAVLTETDPHAFRFGAEGVGWRGHFFDLEELEAGRANFAMSFGSCSFMQPIRDLLEIGWL